jgi:hypothetical protein
MGQLLSNLGLFRKSIEDDYLAYDYSAFPKPGLLIHKAGRNNEVAGVWVCPCSRELIQ